MTVARLLFFTLVLLSQIALAQTKLSPQNQKKVGVNPNNTGVPRRERYTTDLFGESARRVGFKFGPQLSGYTPVEDISPTGSFQSTMRGAFGLTFELLYSVPIFEIDLFANLRGGLNNDSTYLSVAYPILIKLPIALDEAFALEFGGGLQPENVVAGTTPYRSFLFGALGVAGVRVQSDDFSFGLEGRYIHGFQSVLPGTSGTKPRDGALLLSMGLLF